MTSRKDAFDIVTTELRVDGSSLSGIAILNMPLLDLFNFQEVHLTLEGDITTHVAFLTVCSAVPLTFYLYCQEGGRAG